MPFLYPAQLSVLCDGFLNFTRLSKISPLLWVSGRIMSILIEDHNTSQSFFVFVSLFNNFRNMSLAFLALVSNIVSGEKVDVKVCSLN